MNRFAPSIACLLISVACGPTVIDPTWNALAEGGAAVRFSPLPPSADGFREGLSRPIRLAEMEGQPYLQTSIARSEWSFDPDQQGGIWIARVSLLGIGVPPDDLPSQILGTERISYTHESPSELTQSKPLAENSFHAFPTHVALKLMQGEEPLDGMTLGVFAGRASQVHGRHRVRGRRFAGEGFAFLPGEAVEIPVRLAPGSALSFTTCSEAAVPVANGQALRFRVLLDGEPLFEHSVTRLGRPLSQSHRIAIPLDAPETTLLRFEVDGPLSYAAILAPVIGPSVEAGYSDRSAIQESPNIIVFLADTFRADNMEAYGGQARLTPFLNSYAKTGALFRRAWSTGTFTLPAHVSMFTGAYPRQAGIVGTGRALPEEWITLAERLTASGYRTGAITDSGIVTQQFGLDQGFAWWDERAADLDSTLERTRAFLDADDGRPIFLFVQTYRTHLPYVVSPQTRGELGDLLDLEGDWAQLNQRFKLMSRGTTAPPTDPTQAQEWLAIKNQLHDLYRGGSRDLDRGFEEFVGDLKQRGLDGSYLLFTSDHGEGFLEHDALYHTGKVWEELVRIPMLLVGPDIPAEVTDTPASLIDMAPTIADLAGLTPEPEWHGSSLLKLPKQRPLFAFECRKRDGSTLAILDSDHKLITFEDQERLQHREFAGAYDLALDPWEQHNLATLETPWARQLLQLHALQAAQLLNPLIDPTASRLDAGKRQQLGALGYADE